MLVSGPKSTLYVRPFSQRANKKWLYYGHWSPRVEEKKILIERRVDNKNLPVYKFALVKYTPNLFGIKRGVPTFHL
jgi:hypothetical protein